MSGNHPIKCTACNNETQFEKWIIDCRTRRCVCVYITESNKCYFWGNIICQMPWKVNRRDEHFKVNVFDSQSGSSSELICESMNVLNNDTRIPWLGDRPMTWLPSARDNKTTGKSADKHPRAERDSSPRSQCYRGRRPSQRLWSAHDISWIAKSRLMAA
jgi:hypothetical protein